MVRQWSAKPLYPGSNPGVASPNLKNKGSPGGEIGRRKGLKIPREQSHAGSSPALGTPIHLQFLT